MPNPLAPFLPPVQRWFRATYGRPTPPQALGWPAIQRGEHTLILSPTGSGKTLAAFLWGIDRIYRRLIEEPETQGVQILYISPLKALNNDIERNLRAPQSGIRRTAQEMGQPLPPLRVSVRTGDTPSTARQAMVRKPPHILITTPESLYLILTSPKAREMLHSVRTVIVDEIHTLCGNKRGVHLALSLERLEEMADASPQRIGLSATQRPLDEVGRFLVGQEWETAGEEERLVARALTIVDAGAEKDLDLKVVTVVPDLRQIPGGSIWPHIIPHVLQEVRRHRTTLIFTNGRRAAERTADRLNEQFALEEEEVIAPGSPLGLLKSGVPKGQGMFGTGRVDGPFRAHHGSVAKEIRLELEQKLKAGELPALIGTSSLELGIDIGSVDAVIQLQSPRGVARGLQRVGRSGHLVGQTSVGRIYATHREDLLDAAAVAHGMLNGDIEPTYTPQNCLDVLAQQIVAMVSVHDWDAQALYRLVRRAYGYQNLPWEAYTSVLGMLTLSDREKLDGVLELRPRIAWDRVHNRLSALPGSWMLAIRNGGTITDRGEFRVVLPDGKTTLGTLDEEFVFETRRGDVFTLGSNTWRVIEIDEDKVIVAEAEGSMPRMPFWHGELPKRDYYLGLRLGAFRRELADRVADLPQISASLEGDWGEEGQAVVEWLEKEYAMDERSARNAMHYVRSQLDVLGTISADDTVIIECFNDALGDPRAVIHSCFGGRVNSAWALVLAHALREELGMSVEIQVNDDGILLRLMQIDRDLPTANMLYELMRRLGPEEARQRLLWELPESALFGAQFRMNASRALLLPGTRGSRRTPFWLQRLRAKDLLAIAKGQEDFPLILETYRDCLRDVLDLKHLMEVLGRIAEGEIRLVVAETLMPSPVAAGLLLEFMNVEIYEDDVPKLTRQMQALALNRELLAELLDEELLPDLLRPEAITAVEAELQHIAEGFQARSPEELALILRDLGDLSTEEVTARCLGEGRAWLLRLAAEGRVFKISVPAVAGGEVRWINAEDYRRYRDAWGLPEVPPLPLPEELLRPTRSPEAAREALLRRMLRTHAPLTIGRILERYAFPAPWLEEKLEELAATGHLVAGRLSPRAQDREWCDRQVLERIHRRTLSLLRREVQPVELPIYADFLCRWQGAHPSRQRRGREGLIQVMQQMRGLSAPAALWERDLLPARIEGYRPALLDELCREGDPAIGGLVWTIEGDDPQRAKLRFFFRGEGRLFLGAGEDVEEAEANLSERARAALQTLRQEGALYAGELRQLLGLQSAELDAALVELALAGLITNDSPEALRILLAGAYAQLRPAAGIRSSLDEVLGEWRARREPSLIRRPSKQRLREAQRRAAEQAVPSTSWGGRWSLVHRAGTLGPPLADEERVALLARQFLLRYGVVTRECVVNEEGPWDWATLYRHLQRMELRGEVRRGYFVRGLSGVQFALPEAVRALREAAQPDEETPLVVLNACDPAMIYGPALSDGTRELGAGLPEVANPYRFARLPSNLVVLQRGVPILLYEHGGARWRALPTLNESTLREAVSLLLRDLTRGGGLCAHPRRVLVQEWNGAPPIGTAMQPLLESLGFRRESPAMVWDGL
ncbi:MAG: DEAD/DEAH box helicase [Chloroflexi bacterium]|nr:DEAD/DEAH box helicase [Chloroflexota bacterium]